jgi:hypothetical protein
MAADVSKTSIANLALAHLGITKQIARLDERSLEANVCRQFFDQVRDQVISDFDWGFATAFAKVGLVQKHPTCEWQFSYRYPSGCLKVRRVLSGRRTDTRQSRVPFKVGADSEGELIFTDKECAEIEFTMFQDDPTKYTPDFVMAFSLALAIMIAPGITAGDPFNITAKCSQKYDAVIGRAQSNNANEEQPDQEPDSEYDRARGGTGYWPNSFRRFEE